MPASPIPSLRGAVRGPRSRGDALACPLISASSSPPKPRSGPRWSVPPTSSRSDDESEWHFTIALAPRAMAQGGGPRRNSLHLAAAPV